MTIYRYQSDSLVDSVQILTNEKGGMRAYLSADNAADSEKLRLLKQALRADGYKCVPTLNEDKPVLEVRGFKKSDELLQSLVKLKAMQGQPQITAEDDDHRTTGEKTKNASLKLAGLSYNMGDAAYLAYSTKTYLHEYEPKVKGGSNLNNVFNIVNIVAGVGYALGSSVLSLYGSKDQSLNTINAANKKIYAHFRKEDVDVPEGSTLKAAMHDKDRGVLGNIQQFLGKYPSETFNTIYVGVGAALMAIGAFRATRPLAEAVQAVERDVVKRTAMSLAPGGKPYLPPSAEQKIEQAREKLKAEWWDVGLGTVTTTSALIGLCVKEKKPIEGEPKRHGLGKILDFIQEKPLRATGIGYMISTGFHGVGTYKKLKNDDTGFEKEIVKFRGVFVGANVLSELLLGISSKGHGVGVKPDNSVDQSVIASAAELIVRQPADKRETMIQNMAGFMSSRDVLGGKAETIATELNRHIEALTLSPWTKHYVPGTNGQMVEEAPKPALPAPSPTQAASLPKPSTTVSHVRYDTKQRPAETALA